MKATCVFLTYNRKGIVSRCFCSLAPMLLEYEFEWIILDNASTDGTAEYLRKLAKRYPVKVKLSAKNRGVAGGREILFDMAQNPIIISLDSDVEAREKDWFIPLVETAQNATVGIVGAMGWFLQSDWKIKQAPPSATVEVDILSGYCHVFRRDLLEKVRLDQAFNYGGAEDDDMSFQAKAAGYSIWQCGNVPLTHIFSNTWDGSRYDQHRAKFRQKWEGKGLAKFERQEPAWLTTAP